MATRFVLAADSAAVRGIAVASTGTKFVENRVVSFDHPFALVQYKWAMTDVAQSASN